MAGLLNEYSSWHNLYFIIIYHSFLSLCLNPLSQSINQSKKALKDGNPSPTMY